MKSILFFIAILIIGCTTDEKNIISCNDDILIDYYGRELGTNLSDTVYLKIDKRRRATVFLSSCKGGMSFIGYQDEMKEVSGFYKEAEYLTYSTINIEEADGPKVEKWNYYKPQKDGEWKYWNKEGELIKEEIWDKGVLKETKEY